MVKNSRPKRLARALAAELGISYTAARRLVANGVVPGGGGGGAGDGQVPFSAVLAEEVEALLATQLPGQDFGSVGDLDELNAGLNILQPEVVTFTPDMETMTVSETGSYEGNTKTIEVAVVGELTWQGYLDKATAAATVDAGQAVYNDRDATRHDALLEVTSDFPVTVTLLGVVTPDIGTVDSLELGGMVVGEFA